MGSGLRINCPLCNGKLHIRTSERPTPTTVTALLFCANCGNFKGKFMGEITETQTASWKTNHDIKNSVFEKNKLTEPDL
ncbi:hypothetical protein ACFHYJ_07590 [Pasteurella multocida]|uniref:hypothetical protein n=1 Tax=Pasteurella oralis TaxID=1071947 RepID=UPI0026F4CAA7|nr:hypothetical protein [Pasteurella oralis]